jgi:very-short-patch-repair endonuclease
MPKPPEHPAELAGTVFKAKDALDSGLLTKRQLSSTAWRRLFRGIYADAALPVDHALRCLGAHLLMPAQAAIAGHSAAYLYGAKVADTDAPVEVVVPWQQRFGPTAGLRIRFAELPREDVEDQRPRSTTPVRTAADVAMGRDLIEAVVILDALAAGGVFRPLHVDQVRERLAKARGGRRGLRALDLHDRAAESPQESRLRVRLVLAGLPKPVSQYVIRDKSRAFVARVDLAWPASKVAVEYDGEWHADAAQLRRDRRRLNQLTAAGWTVLHVTADRLRHQLDQVVAEIAACLAR